MRTIGNLVVAAVVFVGIFIYALVTEEGQDDFDREDH